MSREVQLPLSIDDIDVPDGRRHVDAGAVKRLAESIDKLGLRTPITVRKRGDRYTLVAGLHRMAAFKLLEREHIPAVIASLTHSEARMWEISENLHRSDLTKLERAEQIEEWRKIAGQIAHQAHNSEGVSKAAETLGIDRKQVRQAREIVENLTPEAREAAIDAGFDDNQSKLLEIAKAPPERQVATVHRLREVKMAAEPLGDAESIEIQVAALMASWNKASPEARKEFMARIDTPIMDRRYGA
jgi:ParB/RepB/Spo0J family partition protein